MVMEAAVEFLWWVLGGGGVQSHFHVQPNYSVEVVLWLCSVVVGIVTKRERERESWV